MTAIPPSDAVPCIYVIGAQSTGKSTLVSHLERLFEAKRTYHGQPVPRPQILQEVARKVLRDNNLKATEVFNSKEQALELQRLIIDAQCKAENEVNGWYISDRSVLDALVYAQQYGGSDESLTSMEQMEDAVARLRDGIIVLCEPVEKWLVKDGVRLMPGDIAEWLDLHQRFQQNLAALKIDHLLLPQTRLDIDERAACVIEYWESKGKTMAKGDVK